MDFSQLQAGNWLKLYIPEAVCAFSGDYAIHVKKGDPKRLIFHLCGGGASWCEDSAKWPSVPETAEKYGHVGLYTVCGDPQPEVFSIVTGEQNGLHSTTAENPFADWSEILVTYATGDFHAGAGELTFTGADGEEHTLHHRGYTNLLAVLKVAKDLFPSLDQLMIYGESAGAFGVAAVAGDIMDRWPDCGDVTILSDSAMLPYDGWGDTARRIWQCPEHIASAVHSDNITLDWFKALYRKYGDKPRYLFSCGNFDHILMMFWHYAADGQFIMDEEYAAAFRRHLTAMCRELKALSPRFGLYIHDFMKETLSPGVLHCCFGCGLFTEGRTDGVSPAEWLKDALDGRIYDVGLGLLEN